MKVNATHGIIKIAGNKLSTQITREDGFVPFVRQINVLG